MVNIVMVSPGFIMKSLGVMIALCFTIISLGVTMVILVIPNLYYIHMFCLGGGTQAGGYHPYDPWARTL